MQRDEPNDQRLRLGPVFFTGRNCRHQAGNEMADERQHKHQRKGHDHEGREKSMFAKEKNDRDYNEQKIE